MTSKKLKSISGVGNDLANQLTVQKSRPLFALCESDLTLAEFKILDTYLSRINSRNPEKRVVVFEKGELEKLLGVKKINNCELEKRLRHLMGYIVKVNDPTKKKSFSLISLFEEAVSEQDENGLWEIRLECTQKAMKYFFNIESLGYLRYKLRCVTSLSSRYTYLMLMYFQRNQYRKSWSIGLDELKKELHCENEETYKEYKRFNDRLLKRVQKEMNEKTECRFNYEPIKKGRSVVAIKFTLETLSDIIKPKLDGQTTLLSDQEKTSQYQTEDLAFLAEACNYEFNNSQMIIIKDLLVHIVPEIHGTERYDYLQRQYNTLSYYHERSPIKNRFNYFKTMLTGDFKDVT